MPRILFIPEVDKYYNDGALQDKMKRYKLRRNIIISIKGSLYLIVKKNNTIKKMAFRIIAVSKLIFWKIFAKKDLSGRPVLFFGRKISPKIGAKVHGGAVKLKRLQQKFMTGFTRANIVYLVSSALPIGVYDLIKLAKKRKMIVVWNQNGVSYPASMPESWKRINSEFIRCIHLTDYVIYQSKYCKRSADKFLGEVQQENSIIYNCVDTAFFKPLKKERQGPMKLLLGGNQVKRYRVEVAVKTLAEVAKVISDCFLVVTGRVQWNGKNDASCIEETIKMARQHGVADRITFTGTYAQDDAPDIYNSCDILLHTQWNDACPGLVIEAMACGLPVVYSKTGGTPELVGFEGGIGVEAKEQWDICSPPSPLELAKAVVKVADRLKMYSNAARQRAENIFNIEIFNEKHNEIFTKLLECHT